MDERPPVWVGHIWLMSSDVPRSAAFWESVGMRMVESDNDVAILELRGGTHLLVIPGDGPPPGGAECSFDLMVDDVDATHAAFVARGLDPAPIEKGRNHRQFTIRDPDGYTAVVRDSHVIGPV